MNIDLSTIQSAAGQAEKVLEEVARVEPTIASIAGMFIPGVSLAQPYILAALPAVENALKAVAAGNGGDMVDALGTLIKHLLPGHANAAALAPEAPTPAVTAG